MVSASVRRRQVEYVHRAVSANCYLALGKPLVSSTDHAARGGIGGRLPRIVKSCGLRQEFITPHCPQQNGKVG